MHRALGSLFTCLLLCACAAPPAEKDSALAAQAATEDAPQTECRNEAPTGSIRRREVCRETNNKTGEMRDEVNEMGRKTIPNQNGF